MTDFAIRPASLNDVGTVVDWAAAEGWNPGLSDAACFFAADPTGFFVGEVRGRIVSAISAVKYDSHYGFVGLYIVDPEFRGRGFGLATWHGALQSAAGRNLGLDAVTAQAGNYARMGFAACHRTIRHEARGFGGSSAPDRPAWEYSPESIEAFDRRYFPAARPAFLRSWLTQPGAITAVDDEDGRVHAYGVMRPCREGWKIAPLFAESAAKASRVLTILLGQTGGQSAFLDIPETNLEGLALAAELGMVPVFETIRMYSRGAPEGIDPGGIYGFTSLELG